MYQSFGKVKYDPYVERGTFVPGWVILLCDKELLRYYQHIFYKLNWKKLQTAMWSSHISIVRGEQISNIDNWKKFNGKIIEFNYEYSGTFETNGKHFWLKVWSEEFSVIRKSLGLSSNPKIPFHLSIGSLSEQTL